MRDFRKIKAWEKAHNLVLTIYKITEGFPRKEEYRLTSQLIRAISSIPTNIAEGCGKPTKPDMARYFHIAIGSTNEVEYLLLLSKDLKYINDEEYKKLNNKIIEIRKMIYIYVKKLI